MGQQESITLATGLAWAGAHKPPLGTHGLLVWVTMHDIVVLSQLCTLTWPLVAGAHTHTHTHTRNCSHINFAYTAHLLHRQLSYWRNIDLVPQLSTKNNYSTLTAIASKVKESYH